MINIDNINSIKDLCVVVEQLINNINNKTIKVETGSYPKNLEPIIQEAVSLKRSAKYIDSAKKYLQIYNETGILYCEIGRYLYKTILCSNAIFIAFELLQAIALQMFNKYGYNSIYVLEYRLMIQDFLNVVNSMKKNNFTDSEPMRALAQSLSGQERYELTCDNETMCRLVALFYQRIKEANGH